MVKARTSRIAMAAGIVLPKLARGPVSTYTFAMRFGLSASRSLRGSIMAVIAVTYVLVTVGVLLAFYLGARSVSDRYAARFAVSQNLLEKNKILALVDRELALSLKLADDQAIRAWMGTEGDPSLRDTALAQLESYRRFLRDGAYFVAIRPSGNFYARTPETSAIRMTRLDPTSPGDRWFYQFLEENKDYALNVDHNDLLGENRLWINVLVRDSHGEAVGAAGCGMDLTAFLAEMVGNEEPGISTVIVDRAGSLQAHGDQSLIRRNAEAKSDGDRIGIYDLLPAEADRKALERRIGALSRGEEAAGVFPLTMGGKRLLCAAGAMPQLGWYNLVFVDAASIIGPADFLPVGIAALASLLFVLASVVVALERLVLRPLKALDVAAGEVAGGAYDVVLPVRTADEIGHLSASFNAMTAKVRSYTAGLESMVAERTRELKEALARVELMAHSDVLTGLPNRRAMLDRLDVEMARAERYGTVFSVVLFDVDDFKRVNDTHGHDAGDEVLKRIAKEFQDRIRRSDACARWGGEEFLMLYPETGPAEAVEGGDKCRLAVAAAGIPVSGKSICVTISGGVSAYRPGLDLDQILKRADEALYRAKAAGKNRILPPLPETP